MSNKFLQLTDVAAGDVLLFFKSQQKASYHCSEFVVASFTATGIIEPSAAIVYRASVISPGDLGRDATFGFFDGYLTQTPGYQAPEDDDFFYSQPFSEILKDWDD